MSQPIFKFYGYDDEVVAEMHDDKVKVTWDYIGEGYNGNYNPSDPDDVELLRFYVYYFDGGTWEYVEDGSCCTNMPLRSDEKLIRNSLAFLFEKFSDPLQEWPYVSIKHLSDELSWIDPSWVKL